MSERERWVVYPLLFLALGASLRDKLGGRTTTKSIVCQELRIEDEPVGNQAPRPLAILGKAQANAQSPAYGIFYVNGKVEVDGALQATQFVSSGAGGRAQDMLLQGFLRALQSGQLRISPNANDRQASPIRPTPAEPTSKGNDSDAGAAMTKSGNSDDAAK